MQEEEKIIQQEQEAVSGPAPEEAQAASEPVESVADRVRIISPFRLVMKRFFRSRLCVAGLIMFIFLILFSFLGPVFVDWKEEEVDYSGTG